MRKIKSIPYMLFGSLMVLATFLPLCVSAMDPDEDSISGRSSPRSSTQVPSLEILAAEEVVRPYVTELKEVLGRAFLLKQRMKEEEKARQREESARWTEAVTRALMEGTEIPSVKLGFSSVERYGLSLHPQDDPIYRSEEGEVLRHEINRVLDNLLFVLDPEILRQRQYADISGTDIGAMQARAAEIFPGLNECKSVFCEAVSRQLNDQEKYLLPSKHLVARHVHYDKVYTDSYWVQPVISVVVAGNSETHTVGG